MHIAQYLPDRELHSSLGLLVIKQCTLHNTFQAQELHLTLRQKAKVKVDLICSTLSLEWSSLLGRCRVKWKKTQEFLPRKAPTFLQCALQSVCGWRRNKVKKKIQNGRFAKTRIKCNALYIIPCRQGNSTHPKWKQKGVRAFQNGGTIL